MTHFLNGRQSAVSAEVCARIKEVVRKYDYRPNALVRGMKSNRTQVFGMVAANMGISYFNKLVMAVESAGKLKDYQCFLCQTYSSGATLEKEINVLSEYRVDGFVVMPVNSQEQPEIYQGLIQRGVPFVLLDTDVDGVDASYAGSDNVEIGRLATHHLLDLGHRKIACVRGHPKSSTARQRFDGYRKALQEAGIPMKEALVKGEGFEVKTGEQSVQELLASRQSFTALVAPNDYVALGAIRALGEAGLRVPQDVSVIGCANLDFCEIMVPHLTSMDQKPEEVGRAAFDLLFDQIEKTKKLPKKILIQPEIVVRDSSARAPKRAGGKPPAGSVRIPLSAHQSANIYERPTPPHRLVAQTVVHG